MDVRGRRTLLIPSARHCSWLFVQLKVNGQPITMKQANINLRQHFIKTQSEAFHKLQVPTSFYKMGHILSW